MIRKILLFIGWSSIVGSFFDAALGFYALWLISTHELIAFSLSLDGFLKGYVGFIYWVKQLAFYIMPTVVAKWLFSIPALVYFPVRITMSIVIGWWALRKAEELNNQNKVLLI